MAAWLFFGALALALLFWLVAALRASPYTVVQSLAFFVDFLLTRLLWSADAPACLPIPAGQGVVIVSNHRSSVDPFFVQLSARRPVHWMVADEYCRHPFFGPFLRFTQSIPTRRGGADMASTKLAIRLVREGGAVGMFPEGRINMTDAPMLPVRPGAVLVALRARAVILPCWIEGSPYDRVPWSPFFMAAQVRVRFGHPIDLSDHFPPCEIAKP